MFLVFLVIFLYFRQLIYIFILVRRFKKIYDLFFILNIDLPNVSYFYVKGILFAYNYHLCLIMQNKLFGFKSKI